jgi:hypothetical protein
VAQFIFIVGAWVELTAERNTGIEHMRMCSDEERAFIKHSHDSLIKKPHEDGLLYWNNLYINGEWLPSFPQWQRMSELVEQLLKENYPGQKRYLRSCGFITSPANSTRSQAWHYDYTVGTSNLFVPLTDTTHRNATQFVRGERPDPLPASQVPHTCPCARPAHTSSQYFPEPKTLLSKDSENKDAVEMCQAVCKAYSILKMYPAVMHRGIQNGEK